MTVPYRLHVTCENCWYRQTLERVFRESETVHLICANCESRITVARDAWFVPSSDPIVLVKMR